MMVGTGAPLYGSAEREGTGVAARLRREVEGEVLFDPFSRGRYSTDASIYQIEPMGVVLPRTTGDLERVVEIAELERVPLVLRGAGTSQAGQAIGHGLVVDTSKHLTAIRDFDRRGGHGGRRAGSGARPAERVPQTARPLFSRGPRHCCAGHHRRHGGEQQRRRPLTPLRVDGGQRAGDLGSPGGRRAASLWRAC
jgi:hypothetical protein